MGSETRKKTRRVMVRMTPQEWESIEALADTCSLSVPEFMRQMALGFQPKSTQDADHILAVAKLAGDLGRIGGLLKLWLSTDSIKSAAFPLEVPKIINELKLLKDQIGKVFRTL